MRGPPGATDSPQAHLNLGVALQEQGDLKAALAAYQRALEIDPKLPGVHWNLGLAHEQLGDAEAPRSFMRRCRRIRPIPTMRLSASAICDYSGPTMPGASRRSKCLAKRPNWPEARLNLGIAHWRSGDKDAAQACFQELTASGADSKEALRGLAALSLENRRYDKAFEIYRQLLDAGERSPELLYNAGLICQRRGEPENAAVLYKEALKADPQFGEALLNLGHALMSLGNEFEARSCWRKAVIAKPELAQRYFEPAGIVGQASRPVQGERGSPKSGPTRPAQAECLPHRRLGQAGRPVLLDHSYAQARAIRATNVHPLSCLFKIHSLGGRNIKKHLRVAVGQGKPGTLDLHHNPVSRTKDVANIRHCEGDLRLLAGDERLGFVEAIPEFAAKWLAANHLLVTAHAHLGRIRIGIGIVVGINVDQLDHEIRIRAARGNFKHRLNRACDGHVLFERAGLINEHVGAPGGEALVMSHVIARHSRADFRGDGHGLRGIADILVVSGSIAARGGEGQSSARA